VPVGLLPGGWKPLPGGGLKLEGSELEPPGPYSSDTGPGQSDPDNKDRQNAEKVIGADAFLSPMKQIDGRIRGGTLTAAGERPDGQKPSPTGRKRLPDASATNAPRRRWLCGSGNTHGKTPGGPAWA
jgi:hypothetical protein